MHRSKVAGPRILWNLPVTRSDILAFMFSQELDLLIVKL